MADGGTVCRCRRGTLYDVLQVSPWCESDVIQAAYRALARTRHPDVNRSPDAEDQMRRLNVAYQILSDPARRVRYDEELALEITRALPASGRTPRAGPPASAAPSDGLRERAAGSGAWSTARPTPRSRPEPGGDSRRVSFSSMRSDYGMEAPLLPRPVLFFAVVLVTAIAALMLWLLIDGFVDRPIPTYRGAGVGEERDFGVVPRAPRLVDGPAPFDDPAPFRPSERWNR
jgi:hypothetical protein